jgi:spermidine/putrescine transport system permease protein
MKKSFPALLLFTLFTLFSLPSCSRQAAAPELNILVFSDYVPQSVIDGFTKDTGIKVNVTTYDTNEEMLSKLLAGGAR